MNIFSTASRKKVSPLSLLMMVCLLLLGIRHSAAAADPPDNENKDGIAVSSLTTLSLEALMDIEITSASRKSQRLADTASAVFVISQEDIRTSGATSIPDLLRMAPGVQVARIDSSKWAVSIRGMNGRFSNKLLVLKDGRSIYTPLFSGIYWETEDTPLEDIERIEVVRGPSAALWGSNAVNGVINIITKAASDTHGTLVSAGAGSFEKQFGTVRYGSKLGESTDFRVYAKHSGRGDGELSTGGAANDSWNISTGGFRLDSQLSTRDTVTLQGDIYTSSYNETYTLYHFPSLTDPTYSSVQQASSQGTGGNLRSRWQRTLSYSDSIAIQLSYDHYQRTMVVLDEVRDTMDLDFQHRFALGGRHDIIWGADYRYTHDNLGVTPYISFSEPSKGATLLSGYLHDEISLIPTKLALILGSRLEYNDNSDLALQPNGRLIWTPLPQHTFWGAISHAVRTPSRGDSNIAYRYRTIPPGALGNPLPMQLEIDGTSKFASENVVAYEVGYRTEPFNHLTLDVSLFYNDYSGLRVLQTGTPGLLSPTTLLQPMLLSNDMHGHTYGGETSVTAVPYDWWKLQLTYSYLESFMYLDNGSSDETNRSNASGGSPRNQFSLRSQFDLGNHVELDFWLRGVGRIDSIDSVSIAGYLTGDIRLAWKPSKTVELALVGQNLLQSRHAEYIPEFINTTPSELPRSVYGKLTLNY
jgi:iron complex outermembrane recepter protein